MVTALLVRSEEEVDARLEAMSHDARVSRSALAAVDSTIRRARSVLASRPRRLDEGIAMRMDALSRRGAR